MDREEIAMTGDPDQVESGHMACLKAVVSESHRDKLSQLKTSVSHLITVMQTLSQMVKARLQGRL